MLIKIDPIHPDPEILQQAAEVLRRGGVIAAPTDTVYGLLAAPDRLDAISRIYAIKGRERRQPLILLIADWAMLPALARDIPPGAKQAMARFWPGGLTLVLKKAPALPDLLSANDTIGIRWPRQEVMAGLIRACGGPLASTSANLSGRPPATTGAGVEEALAGKVDLILEAGPSPLGEASSVLDFAGGEPPRLLRPGSISRRELEAALGPIRGTDG
jgi:L-threonylcarbamoyladenylate synthase